MEFNSNKPIYMQICDALCEKILSGELGEGGRLLSVREYGSDIGVNPNTVMRSYERLTGQGIIHNKRGIGYFVSDDAVRKVLEIHKTEFLEEELPLIVRKMRLLGITFDEFKTYWNGTV